MRLKEWLTENRIPTWAMSARLRCSLSTLYRLISPAGGDMRFSLACRIVKETAGAVSFEDLIPPPRFPMRRNFPPPDPQPDPTPEQLDQAGEGGEG